MKFLYILFIFLLFALHNQVTAQCSMSVPNYSTGDNVANPLVTSYVQTFKPTCNSVLTTMVFPTIYSGTDDFRGTGYFVTCIIKDASGNILATAPRTDQWYPGGTVTFDFTCFNISFTANTTYQFELRGGNANGIDDIGGFYLLRRSNTTSVYADGFCTLNGTAFPNSDLYGWTVNSGQNIIASATTTQTQNVTTCSRFANPSTTLLAFVNPVAPNAISGNTTAKVWIETTQSTQFVKRHYEIVPAANATTATGKVTLYFTQQEFTDFNAVNSSKLPTGPADAAGISNLILEKRPGTSSDGTGLPNTYTGTPVTTDPADADIVWNAGASRWEVSFNVTGFGGFFVKTNTPITPAPTASAQSHCQGKTVADLVATGQNIQWYTASTGGTALATTTILITATYYASQTVSGVESARTAVSVTVNALPTATASSNSPICAGTTLNLLGGTQGLVSYTWTGVNSFSSTLQNPSIPSATTSANGTYRVTVSDNNGCTASATTSVVVNTLPTATASSNSPICAGTTLNLLGGTQGLVSYTWTGVNSFSSIQQNPSIASATTSASGTYRVTVSDNNGCTATATTSVVVNTLPTATASSNSPICAGTTLNLLGGTQGLVSYTWTGVNSFSSIQQNPSIPSATTSASGTYRVTVSDNNGCTALATTSVVVNALPTATASSNSPICAGTTLNLLGGTQGLVSYTWTGVNSFSSTLQNPSIPSATTSANGTYRVTVSDNNGCTASATTSVVVNTLPTATASSNSPVCAGTTLNLLGGAQGLVSYTWTGVNSFSSIQQNPSIPSAITSASGTYRVTVSDNNGCTASATTSVIVNVPTTATVTLSPTTICAGTSGTITPTVTNGGSSYSYVWKINQVTQTVTSPTITYSNATGNDEYSFTVTPSADACPSIASITTSVRITPLTVPKVFISPAIVCENTDRTLGVVSSSGSLGTTPSYVWKRNNANVTTNSTYSVTNAVLGDSYAVTVTLSQDAGCYTTYTATSSLIVGCILSITSGNWEDPATWNLNRAPLTTDNAVINNNHNVTINTDGANANKTEVRVNSKLIYGNSAAKLKLGF